MTLTPDPKAVGREFFIEGTLLADDTRGWRNLGDWSAAEHYCDAAEALATRIGRAAGLREGTKVLDLACGHGASLLLWPRTFGVSHVAGLELQAACIETLQTLTSENCTIAQGRFDQLPLPKVLSQTSFDAVVCVDAAYHARSLQALSEVAASVLRDGGRFTFSTLALNAEKGALPAGLSWGLRSAGIKPSSLLSPDSITATMNGEGFNNVAIELLDQSVMAGFADYVKRRERALRWHERLSPGWLKIKATGRLCAALAKNGRMHYVLVTAKYDGHSQHRPL